MPSNNTTTTTPGNETDMNELLVDGKMQVEQGPAWLIDLLFNPPGWLSTLLGVAALASLLLAGLALYRNDWTLPDDAQAEVLANAVLIESILVTTVWVVFHHDLSYALDVTAGFVGGLLASVAVRAGARQLVQRGVLDDIGVSSTGERFVLAWVVVAVVAMLPMQLVGRGAMPLVFNGSIILVVVSVALTAYNAAELTDSRKTEETHNAGN
jgi:hypothetical protein